MSFKLGERIKVRLRIPVHGRDGEFIPKGALGVITREPQPDRWDGESIMARLDFNGGDYELSVRAVVYANALERIAWES